MSSGSALRFVLIAAAAIAIWKVAYELSRPGVPSTPAKAHIGKMPDRAVVHDAWQDAGQRAKLPKVAESRTTPPMPLPEGPFGDNVAELKRRVEAGDSGAAVVLAKGLRICRYYRPPKNPEELQQRLEEITVNELGMADQLADFVKQHAEGSGVDASKLPKLEAMQVYNEHLRTETEHADNCRGVDAADAKQWGNWYLRAAELGDADAEVTYWRVVTDQSAYLPLEELPPQKAAMEDFLQRALARGDWRALAAIGELYSQGWLAEPDPFYSHAYFFAAAQAPEVSIFELPWMGDWLGPGLGILYTGNTTHTYFSRELQRTGAELDPQQIAESEQLGVALYAQCCGGGR